MRIEHIAMYVRDIEQAKWFFEHYFGAVSNEGYYNACKEFRSYFLRFEDGARLEIMNKPELTGYGKELNAYGYVHIAFSVGSKEKVDALTNRLSEAGYTVLSGPRITGDGYYESCIIGLEGNQIEITI